VLDDTLVVGIANHTESSELPFSLGGETIVRDEDTVLAAHLTGFTTGGGIEVVEFVASLTTELASEIDVGLESRLTAEVGKIESNDALVDKDFLINTVGTPDAVLGGLFPRDTDDRILVVDGALEIVVDEALAPSQLVAPAVGVGIDGTNAFGILFAVSTTHPVDELTIGLVCDLSLVKVERRDGDRVSDIVPLITGIVRHATHDKGATLDEDEAGSGDLFVVLRHFETAPIGVIVVPTRGGRFLLAATDKDKGDSEEERCVS
jgi:hypothetical protein